MSDSNIAATTVSIALGASILLVVSADVAAAVATAAPGDALQVIRATVKSGESKIGEMQTDEFGRLQLAQFSDAWNKWKKEFSDSKPG